MTQIPIFDTEKRSFLLPEGSIFTLLIFARNYSILHVALFRTNEVKIFRATIQYDNNSDITRKQMKSNRIFFFITIRIYSNEPDYITFYFNFNSKFLLSII